MAWEQNLIAFVTYCKLFDEMICKKFQYYLPDVYLCELLFVSLLANNGKFQKKFYDNLRETGTVYLSVLALLKISFDIGQACSHCFCQILDRA